MDNLSWVDGLVLFIGVVLGAYLKKAATWIKEKLSGVTPQ